MKEEIAFPYSISMLGFVLKKLDFRFKRRQWESIIHERSDLIAWRESFLRRTREIREKEPERQIVCTDETWLNSGHRVLKISKFWDVSMRKEQQQPPWLINFAKIWSEHVLKIKTKVTKFEHHHRVRGFWLAVVSLVILASEPPPPPPPRPDRVKMTTKCWTDGLLVLTRENKIVK